MYEHLEIAATYAYIHLPHRIINQIRFLVALMLSIPIFIIAMVLPYLLDPHSNPFMTRLYNSFTVGTCHCVSLDLSIGHGMHVL